MAGSLKKRDGETFTVEKNGQIKQVQVYERKVVTVQLVNVEVLKKRKAELEKELQQIGLELAQIEQDEQLDDTP